MATVWGYWTCDYCGQENFGEARQCGGCNKTRGKDVVFYPIAKQSPHRRRKAPKSQGADWYCGSCDSLNKATAEICQQCGCPRDENDGDYFSLHPKGAHSSPEPQNIENEQAHAVIEDTPNSRRNGISKLRPYLAALLGVVLLVTVLVLVFTPYRTEATVIDKSWERSVVIEEYRTVHEVDWSIPVGGRQTNSYQAIHHYDKVLDHYDSVTKSRQVSSGGHYEVSYRQVPNGGYYEVIGYSDNGDGTFDEIEVWHNTYENEEVRTWVVDYETEYYTELVPVYRDEPVYKTKYEYDIERWVFDRYETTSGGVLDEPCFASVEIGSNYRTGAREEYYFITISCENRKGKTLIETIGLNYDEWCSYEIGDAIPVEIYLGGGIKK